MEATWDHDMNKSKTKRIDIVFPSSQNVKFPFRMGQKPREVQDLELVGLWRQNKNVVPYIIQFWTKSRIPLDVPNL